MRGLFLFTLFLVALGSACSSSAASAQPTTAQGDTDPDPYTYCGVSNFAWTDNGILARSSQPSFQSLTCLRDEGFAAIVNLRNEGSGFDEAGEVAALGMAYLHLPMVDDTAPSPSQVTEYLAFIKPLHPENSPALAHCAAGRGRAGTIDGIYLLWKGWSTAKVFERYMHFGAKIDCENGGNGQIQALHEIGLLLGRGDAWPQGQDRYGNQWENCPRPDYMSSWDYGTVEFPPNLRYYLPLILDD